MDLLTNSGWNVRYAPSGVITLGATRSLRTSLGGSLRDVGVTGTDADTLTAKLHRHSVDAAIALIKQRRQLERSTHDPH